MRNLFHTIDREWPQDEDGPVAVLAPNHQPYQATIWERIQPETRRAVLRLIGELKK